VLRFEELLLLVQHFPSYSLCVCTFCHAAVVVILGQINDDNDDDDCYYRLYVKTLLFIFPSGREPFRDHSILDM